MRIFLFFVCVLTSIQLTAQNNNQSPCSLPEASQFDFWIGDWNITYSDTLHASNHIEKIMGGCTVQENFNDPNGNYIGKSWSVYNKNYKMWQQTWVDNQGGYIALTGGMQGDSMVLITPERTVPTNISATGKIIMRMVYHNIKPDSFEWDWEGSTDGGKTWKSNWHLNYQRKQ
jgi:hypothetical protein